MDSAFIYTNVYGNGSANIPLSDCPKNDTVDIPHIALKQPYNYTPDAIQRLRHAYYAEMIQADVNIGKVLDQIDSLDLWKNSVIVFWSDHGLSMGEHDGMYLKIDMFEECLRIPVIICAPGIEPGVCNRLVESVDLFQTLTELCGLPPHGNQEGASFVPLLEKPDLPWKKAIFSNLQRNVNYDTLLATAVRTENWHYNNWQDQGEELYDIINDSQEITNLAQNPAYTDTLNKMRTLMNSGWQAAAPPLYSSSRFYRDADGDGYGSNTDSAYLYFSKDGYVKISGDCDDNNSFVNPAMPETICNNMDDNCNKIIDEGKPLASIAASGEPDICKTTPLTFTANGNDSCIYQWLNNNTPIAGAFKKTITVNETGHYTVIVEWPNGCADTSDEILAYKSCEPQSIIPLYPNPSNGKIIINYLNTLDEVVKINIYNNLGALVYSESDYSKTGINVYTIDLSTRLRPGIYYLRIKDDIKVKFEIVN